MQHRRGSGVVLYYLEGRCILKAFQLVIGSFYSVANVLLYYASVHLIETNNNILMSFVFPLALFFIITLLIDKLERYWLFVSWALIIVLAAVLSFLYGGLAAGAIIVLLVVFLISESFLSLIAFKIKSSEQADCQNRAEDDQKGNDL